MKIDDWANKIYAEEDFGRSISTTLSGIVGLTTYLLSKDWVLSAFVAIILFPLFRLFASALHQRWKEARKRKLQTADSQKFFEKFTPEEKEVIKCFVNAGGAALSYSQINRARLQALGIESLVHRGVLANTLLSDYITEGFILDTKVFDLGQQSFPRLLPTHAVTSSDNSGEIPF